MNYKIEGKGDILLFIHGLSDNLLYWEVLDSHLKKYYQVIRVDLRGHGESELGIENISIDSYVEDLKYLLDELGIENINLIGFSLGGAVALEFTIKYPQFVDSLILMSTFFKADEYSKNIFNQFKNALDVGFEEFVDFMLPLVLCPNVIENHNEELEMLKLISSQSANVEAYTKAVDACLTFDVENELSSIDVSTLILAGQYDEIFPLKMQIEFQNKIKNSKLIVFENTKHNLLVGRNNEKIINIIKKEIK
ncbi:MAG: alpha/beta hydrolase [Methanobrevibacter sp.]|nr:alpha/beta hydrolase [Methanobrevibacter sp.]